MNENSLVFEAKSFYNAYIALEQLEQAEGHSPLLYFIPMVVNGAFSIEITLKAILTKNKIEYGKEHNLVILFQMLPESFQREMLGWLFQKAPEYADTRRLTGELILISSAFVDWRYFYEDNAPALDTRFLSAFANAAIGTMFAHYNVDVEETTYATKSEEEIDEMFLKNREEFREKNLKEIQRKLTKKNQG